MEVILHSPMAAKNFQPGQFFRLQNLEANALTTNYQSLTTTLACEGMAMTGAWVDKDKGLVSIIILEMGGSSDLCAYFKPGEEVVLMGPTGTPTEIPKNETVKKVEAGLQKKGLNIRAIIHPTVEKGKERIRICIHSFNSKKEIKKCVSSLEKLVV